MGAMPAQHRMTANEFVARPFSEDLRGQQLVEGELIVSEPTALHNVVQGNLFYAIASWTRESGDRGRVFSPLDVRLDDLNVFAPDISWYATADAIDVYAPPPYPRPDLAIEVRSPSTWRYDVGAKRSTYERHGLAELWLVDTAAATALAFRRSRPAIERFDIALELGLGDSLESPLLPGFAVALDDLFAVTQ